MSWQTSAAFDQKVTALTLMQSSIARDVEVMVLNAKLFQEVDCLGVVCCYNKVVSTSRLIDITSIKEKSSNLQWARREYLP